MSIGASILNIELTRPHNTFMQQLSAAWQLIKPNHDQEQVEREDEDHDEEQKAAELANSTALEFTHNC